MKVKITHPSLELFGTIELPGSKSESNRALILQALSNGMVQISGISKAKDTEILASILRENPETMDVGHAGTAMRFLTAFLSFRPEDHILTGSDRMQSRPIADLVDALRNLGAEIAYLGKDGYPPLMIFGRNAKFLGSKVKLPGNISSQYISALLLIAWKLPDGIEIEIEGKILSRPYIEMTLELLERFGIQHSWEGKCIKIAKQSIRSGKFEVEADWSAASYWFCMVAMAKKANILLKGLRKESLQGDHVAADKMAELGVLSSWEAEGLRLQKVESNAGFVNWDFSNCPDLAQGMIVALAAKGMSGEFVGLESLRIKETDRIAALQNELRKFGIEFRENEGKWWIEGQFQANAATIPTYQDHRMAMAFAALALVCPCIEIEDAGVVEKSYPKFWQDLESVGFHF